MKKKESAKWLWYLIAIGVVILFMLMLLSSVLDVGERLKLIGIPYLDYVFYGLVFLLVYFLVLRPVHIILFSPSFSVETTLDQDGRKNYALYKKVTKRLLENEKLPDEQKEKLTSSINNYEELREVLGQTYNNHIKKQINKLIKKHAKTVMISTAVSQNGRLDFFTVIAVNLRMIKEIVEICGFRPNMSKLSKLTINVFSTALIAEGLENIDISDVLPAKTMNTLADIPFIRPIMSSVTQGISNALLTLRIGIVTRKYLFSDAKELTKYDIRKGAFLEAAGMLPSVIGDSLLILPKKFLNIFKKKQKKTEDGIEEVIDLEDIDLDALKK
jgi:hypothetical protein